MKNISRRKFIAATSLLTATAPLLYAAKPKIEKPRSPLKVTRDKKGPTRLRWVDGEVPKMQAGTAFGVPWPMGQQPGDATFTLRTSKGNPVAMQTWTTATWPDGSLKWTGHAIAPDAPLTEHFEIVPGKQILPKKPVSVKELADSIVVDTGVIVCRLPHEGKALIKSVKRGKDTILRDGILLGTRQDTPEQGSLTEEFSSRIESLKVEQSGPVRAVIKIDGKHSTPSGREWLPFSVRLYFHAGSEGIRMTHTFVFDGDEHTDFISALGVRFDVPMRDELYNRHIRFSGQNGGLWGEAVQGLTGIRDPGEAVRKAQVAGKKVPDIHTWAPNVNARIHWVPTWGDFTLSQQNSNGFTLRKRTKPGHAWIGSDEGHRADGLGYIGGPSGGLAFGMRDFWKLNPTQLDIRNAASETHMSRFGSILRRHLLWISVSITTAWARVLKVLCRE